MNENLKNYNEQPDPEVWNRIHQTMKKKTLRRQVSTAVAGMALVAAGIVAVVSWPSSSDRLTANVPTQEQSVPMPANVNGPMMKPGAVQHIELSDAQVAENRSVTKAESTRPVQANNYSVEQVTDNQQSSTLESHHYAEPVAVKESSTPVAKESQSKVLPVSANVPTQKTVVPVPVAQPVAEAATPAPVRTPSQPTKSSVTTSPSEDTIFWIPNVFAPASGDETMNVFRPVLNQSAESVTNYRLVIFNRVGHQVFFSRDVNDGWDGTYKGRDLPQASYVYVLSYTDKNRLQHQRKGTVTLIR